MQRIDERDGLGRAIGNAAHPKFGRLTLRERAILAGSEPDESKPVRIVADDVERLGPDGTGTPEDDDVAHNLSLSGVTKRALLPRPCGQW